MFSSQNDQDNRHYAKLGKIPLLEPADSQEAKDFVVKGIEISEKFDPGADPDHHADLPFQVRGYPGGKAGG